MTRLSALLLLLTALLGACSMRSAIDAMSTPQDRAFAQDFVAKLRSGDGEGLQARFDPAVWPESKPQLAQARDLYPPTPGTTELIGYHVATNVADGVSTATRDYTLVTHDGSHWTTTVLRTQSTQNGPPLVVGWNVVGSREMPPAYRQFQAMESAIPWLRAGAAFLLLAFAGLVFWLVRRSRRKHAARG